MLQVDATWFIRRCQIQLGLTGHIFLLIRVEMYSSVEGKKKKKRLWDDSETDDVHGHTNWTGINQSAASVRLIERGNMVIS